MKVEDLQKHVPSIDVICKMLISLGDSLHPFKHSDALLPRNERTSWGWKHLGRILLALRYQIYEIWGAWASQLDISCMVPNNKTTAVQNLQERSPNSQSGPTFNPKQRIFLFKRIIHVISISYKYKMCPNLDPVKQWVMQPIMMTNDQQSVDMAQKWGMKKGVP